MTNLIWTFVWLFIYITNSKGVIFNFKKFYIVTKLPLLEASAWLSSLLVVAGKSMAVSELLASEVFSDIFSDVEEVPLFGSSNNSSGTDNASISYK